MGEGRRVSGEGGRRGGGRGGGGEVGGGADKDRTRSGREKVRQRGGKPRVKRDSRASKESVSGACSEAMEGRGVGAVREGRRRRRKRERERERERGWRPFVAVRERENSNSKTLFYKDCSLGSFKNLTTSPC